MAWCGNGVCACVCVCVCVCVHCNATDAILQYKIELQAVFFILFIPVLRLFCLFKLVEVAEPQLDHDPFHDEIFLRVIPKHNTRCACVCVRVCACSEE